MYKYLKTLILLHLKKQIMNSFQLWLNFGVCQQDNAIDKYCDLSYHGLWHYKNSCIVIYIFYLLLQSLVNIYSRNQVMKQYSQIFLHYHSFYNVPYHNHCNQYMSDDILNKKFSKCWMFWMDNCSHTNYYKIFILINKLDILN